MKTTSNRLINLICVILFIAGVSSCATFKPLPDDQVLKIRVESYINAKKNKEWSKVYSFYEPAYHEQVTEQQFIINMSKMQSNDLTIESIVVDPDGTRATVKVKSDVTFSGFDFKGNISLQTWKKHGREWFLHIPPRDPF